MLGLLPVEPQRWPFCTWTVCCRLAGGRRMKKNSNALASPRRPATTTNRIRSIRRMKRKNHRCQQPSSQDSITLCRASSPQRTFRLQTTSPSEFRQRPDSDRSSTRRRSGRATRRNPAASQTPTFRCRSLGHPVRWRRDGLHVRKGAESGLRYVDNNG